MSDPTQVAARIRAAFDPVEYPGDAYLLGSNERHEPEAEVGPFRGTDWRALDPEFVDRHAAALSFFSQAARRKRPAGRESPAARGAPGHDGGRHPGAASQLTSAAR